jgi:hypothetical protein
MTAEITPELARTLPAAEQHEWFHRKLASRRALLRGGLVGAARSAPPPCR